MERTGEGFRRRQALNTAKNQKMTFIKEEQLPEIKSGEKVVPKATSQHNKSHKKFKKINFSKQQIVLDRKKQAEFYKIIQEVQPRGCTFYRLGFKSYEKKKNHKVFADVLNLMPNQMKGTMYVGELWSNHLTSKFLKQNKIYMNKLKLMDRLQQVKNDYDTQQSPRQSQIGAGSMRSFSTSVNNIKTTDKGSTQQISTDKKIYSKTNINSNIQSIKSKLRALKIQTGRGCYSNAMKQLEDCRSKLDKVERKYFLKMIQLS